jgi:hypothetical protein
MWLTISAASLRSSQTGRVSYERPRLPRSDSKKLYIAAGLCYAPIVRILIIEKG